MRKRVIKIITIGIFAALATSAICACGKKEEPKGSGFMSGEIIPEVVEEVVDTTPQGITVGEDYIVSNEGRFVMRGDGYVLSYACDGDYIYALTAYADMGDEDTAVAAVPIYSKKLSGVESVSNVGQYLVVHFLPEKYELLNREMLETLYSDSKISY